MAKTIGNCVGCVFLGIAFWIPAIVIHFIRGNQFGGAIDVVLMLLLPTLFAIAGFIIYNRIFLGRPRLCVRSLLFIYGIWSLGLWATMLSATFSGGGFNNPETWKFALKYSIMYPFSTYIAATYDGTLGALIAVTLWLFYLTAKDIIMSVKHRTV